MYHLMFFDANCVSFHAMSKVPKYKCVCGIFRAHPVHPLFQILDPPTPVEGQSHSTPRGSLAGLAVAVGHRTNSGQSGIVSSQICDLSGH